MELEEMRTLENIKNLSSRYLNILKPTADDTNNAEIEISNYSELGCIITNMLKLCILGLEHNDSKKAIDVGLILEQVLQLFPNDEFELLDIVNELLVEKK